MRLWGRERRASCTLHDLPEGVQFLVRPERELLASLWNYIYTSFAAYLLTGFLPDSRPWLHLPLALGIGSALGTWLSRQLNIRVTFTRDGVRVRGKWGAGYPAPRWIPLGDISDLLWQAESGLDPESPYQPSGLYARRGLTTVCLLPFLDPKQTHDALRAIESKFSWVDRTEGSANSLLFTDDLVRLDLNS